MFIGYLLKINGTIIPSKYVDVKTYEITPNKRRVLKDGYSSAGIRHVVYSPHTSTEIGFSTNGLMMSGMRSFLGYFPSTDGLVVEYYNDKTDTYDTGVFRLENDIRFSKYRIRENNIIYKAVGISLKED
jgi:hypothetical protein